MLIEAPEAIVNLRPVAQRRRSTDPPVRAMVAGQCGWMRKMASSPVLSTFKTSAWRAGVLYMKNMNPGPTLLMLEENFITSMIKAEGNLLEFVARPIAATLAAVTVLDETIEKNGNVAGRDCI